MGLRVVLISTVPEAVKALVGMLRGLGHEAVAVITRPPVGFPGIDQVVEAADGVDIVVPATKERLAPVLRAYEPDLLLCLAFPWLIPREALDVPRLGAVNTHPSLLPRYRGPNPLGWMFRNDDPEVGLSFHRMDEAFDTGPVLAQGSVAIDDEDDLETIGERKLGPLAASLLPQVLERVLAGDPGDQQPDEGATYAGLFAADDWLEVDWTRAARDVHNQVRSWTLPAVSGVRGPLAELEGERVRVARTRLDPAVEGAGRPGEVLGREDGGLLVQCGDVPIWVVATEPA